MTNIVVDEHLKLYTVAIVDHHILTVPRLSHLWCCDRANKSLPLGVVICLWVWLCQDILFGSVDLV